MLGADLGSEPQDFQTTSSKNLNDVLRLASIWCVHSLTCQLRKACSSALTQGRCRHSLHAISVQLSPVQGCQGIEVLLADTFELHCFQTLTGTKFLIVAEPATPEVDALLKDTCACRA